FDDQLLAPGVADRVLAVQLDRPAGDGVVGISSVGTVVQCERPAAPAVEDDAPGGAPAIGNVESVGAGAGVDGERGAVGYAGDVVLVADAAVERDRLEIADTDRHRVEDPDIRGADPVGVLCGPRAVLEDEGRRITAVDVQAALEVLEAVVLRADV